MSNIISLYHTADDNKDNITNISQSINSYSARSNFFKTTKLKNNVIVYFSLNKFVFT